MPGKAAYTGSIKVSPSTMINGINSIDQANKLNTENTTCFESGGDEEHTATLKAGTLKLTGFRISSDTGQNALKTANVGRTTVNLIFEPATGEDTFTAAYYVTDFNVKSDVGGVQALDVSLLRTGALTITPPA
jgi:hypothetical protein